MTSSMSLGRPGRSMRLPFTLACGSVRYCRRLAVFQVKPACAMPGWNGPHSGRPNPVLVAWAYRVDGVFSEIFPSHDMARRAAERVAKEQVVPRETKGKQQQ